MHKGRESSFLTPKLVPTVAAVHTTAVLPVSLTDAARTYGHTNDPKRPLPPRSLVSRGASLPLQIEKKRKVHFQPPKVVQGRKILEIN